MKKYTVLILSIISILAINIGTALAIDVPPESANCAPNMYIEISNEIIYYDPLISTDCPRATWVHGDSWYALLGLTVTVEHQHLIDGVWQAGPKTYIFTHHNMYMNDSSYYSYLNPYYLYGGGVVIEGYNKTDYDRYRLVAILDGGVIPFIEGGNSQIMYRTDEYVTDWIYGLNATNPTRNRPVDPQVNPDLDDVPDGFADQDGTRPEDEILIRPNDRDRDGIPDATDQCPDVVGIALLQGCPASVDSISNGQNPNLPATGLVCTVETSMAMTFFFDVVPGDPVPLGTPPIALTSIDISDTNQADAWETARLSFNGVEHDYMVYPAWSSLARTGGTCGEFGQVFAESS